MVLGKITSQAPRTSIAQKNDLDLQITPLIQKSKNKTQIKRGSKDAVPGGSSLAFSRNSEREIQYVALERVQRDFESPVSLQKK